MSGLYIKKNKNAPVFRRGALVWGRIKGFDMGQLFDEQYNVCYQKQ
jgi:hypothetical protein